MKVTDRTIAAAMGLTYEGFTGDYSGVNYTSGRMGRMDVDPQIRDWQQNLMIAQVCAGFARWIAEAIADVTDIPASAYEIIWTPPVRPVVDPTKDYKANETAMRSGQKSRRQVVREAGGDPEKVEAEIREERAWATGHSLVFTSDAGASVAGSGRAQEADDDDQDEKGNAA
jgi:capsid protein